MNLSQRQKTERIAKYHFSRLRPAIFRIGPNRQPCKKDCLCKVCKAYHRALEEAVKAAQKEYENSPNSSILNPNQNNRTSPQISPENVSGREDQQTDEQRVHLSNTSRSVEELAG